MTRAGSIALAGFLVLCGAAPAAGQAQEPPVTRLLADLIAASAVIGPGETGDHRLHFVPTLDTIGVVHELNRAIALQAASFPLGPVGAVVTSRGRSGAQEPLFAAGYTDTAFSLGGSRMLFGVSYQTTTFDTFDDLDLRHNPINLYIPHAPGATGDVSDRDMMHQVVSLRLNRKVVAFSLDYGWRDRVCCQGRTRH
jgi:hypothetical protein